MVMVMEERGEIDVTESTKSPAEVLEADEWSELARLAETAQKVPTEWECNTKEGAAFIAAANPAVVLRLISALRQASIRGGEA